MCDSSSVTISRFYCAGPVNVDVCALLVGDNLLVSLCRMVNLAGNGTRGRTVWKIGAVLIV